MKSVHLHADRGKNMILKGFLAMLSKTQWTSLTLLEANDAYAKQHAEKCLVRLARIIGCLDPNLFR